MTTTVDEWARSTDAAALLPGERGRYRLMGTYPISAALPSMFGHLVKMAGSDGKFRSDLYHDALWIDKWFKGPMTFCYGCDDWGTIIGTEGQHVFPNRERFYMCRIWCDWSEYSPGEGTWFFDVVRIK